MLNRTVATILVGLIATAGTAAPAHADPEVNVTFGSEQSPCYDVRNQLEDAQERNAQLDQRVVVLSVRLEQTRSKVERQQQTIRRLRAKLARR